MSTISQSSEFYTNSHGLKKMQISVSSLTLRSPWFMAYTVITTTLYHRIHINLHTLSLKFTMTNTTLQ